ncbi:hypothetical protein EMPS_06768 [Entomortierella parvispora]|uniref:RNI-like protein n=1 Tax=Entomortierella parvispora TaxID=205924 RepID=A0A9P3LY17_9FUNG|nr:hypothetical protein EMPS_06768 [Entomortierella parvispora]
MVYKRESFIQKHRDTLKELSLVLTHSKHETVPRWKVLAGCEKLETFRVMFGRIRPEDWIACWSAWRRLKSLEVKFVRFQKPVRVAENDANYVGDSAHVPEEGSHITSGSDSLDHQSNGADNRNTLSQEIIGPIVWDWPDFSNLVPAMRLRHICLVNLNGLSVADQLSIIQQCPRIESLQWNLSTAHERIPLLDMAESMSQEAWPRLVDLDLMGGVSRDAEVASMLGAIDQGLHRLSLVNSGFAKLSLCALLHPRTKHFDIIGGNLAARSPHAQSLVQLELGLCRFVTSPMAQKIMESCPNLKVLKVVRLADRDILYRSNDDDQEQYSHQQPELLQEAAPWVCIKLEKLELGRIEMKADAQSAGPVSPNNRAILDKLAQLTKLQHLRLRDCDEYGAATADPGGTLVLSLDHGLEKLTHLKDLITVTFDGQQQDMGEQDLRWMARTWPKLASLEGVISVNPETKRELEGWLESRGVTWYSVE